LKRASLLLLAFLCVSLLFLSCGYSAPSSTSGNVTGVQHRALVSQDVSGGNVGAGVNIVDDQKDILSLANVISAGATPGMMVVTPNRNQTLIFSRADQTLNIINNAAERNAAHATLQGPTQSIVVAPDSSTAYVAVPTQPVGFNLPPGAVMLMSMTNAALTAQLDIPAVRYLSISHSGNRVLAFASSPDTTDAPCTPQVPCFVFVITPSNIGTNTNPVVSVPGFDHPVTAFFSNDDNTAYIVNCGANCSGTQASVETLDMTSNTPGTPVNLPAAESATIVGTTMYLAGTPVPASPCTGQKTQATSCGLVTIFDLTTMTVTNNNIVITDGYHDHIAMGANGQLFVGANSCTEISPTPQNNNETRGCLSIYNTQTGAVVIPPAGGDVTGLQPIANRSVVYLVQNGELQIYDTATDKLQATQIDISGEAVDVVAVDQ
jgi:hypothetical protein